MTIKLIALDLDYTLLNQENKISPGNAQAIAQAMAAGVKVTLCTGRMFQSAALYGRELGLTETLISYQGAYARKMEEEKPLVNIPLPMPLAKEIIGLAEKAGLRTQAYVNDRLYVNYIDAQTAAYCEKSHISVTGVGQLKNWLHADPHKVLIEGEPKILDEIWQEWEQALGEEIYLTKSKAFYLECMNPRANKGVALSLLARSLGIKKEEILVCGDSYNDLCLFEAAGIKAAMGNAVPALKEQADYISASYNEDGVAQAIHHFVLK